MTHMRLPGTSTMIVACALICIHPTWSYAETSTLPQDVCKPSRDALTLTVRNLLILRVLFDGQVATYRRDAEILKAQARVWQETATRLQNLPAAISAKPTGKEMPAPQTRGAAVESLRLAASTVDVLTKRLDEAIATQEKTVARLGIWSKTLVTTKERENQSEAGKTSCLWTKSDLVLVRETLAAIMAEAPELVRNGRRIEDGLKNAWILPDNAKLTSVLASLNQSDTDAAAVLAIVPAAPQVLDRRSEVPVPVDAANDTILAAKEAKTALDSPAVSTPAPVTASTQTEVEFSRGDVVRYGLTASLLRIHALRNPAAPGRERSYEPTVDLVPGELGFQFTVAPHHSPMRLRTKDGTPFQLIGMGGMLLLEPHFADERKRSSLSLAAFLSFLDDTIGVGIGFDLYRAVPVRGADGQSGTAFAQTGLLGWAMSPAGEITPENLLFLVTVNASGIAAALVNKQGGAK